MADRRARSSPIRALVVIAALALAHRRRGGA